jgi:hypothetical protein
LDAALQSLLEVGDLLRRPDGEGDRRFTTWADPWSFGVPFYVAGILREGARLAASPAARAAAGRSLLLTGRAGAGKTHLLCDVARGRTAEGRPTVLILGQDFGGSQPLLAQVARLSQLGETPDDVFAVLNAASEAAGCIGLLMIDALNESERPERWREEAQALAAMAERYPHVAVVLSCRTEFLGKVIGDTGIPAVEHVGFGEATDSAIRRFTREYRLELPAFPVLNPEFGNPLFLKLACEALDTLGRTRFPLGTAGLGTVCGAFFEAVNKRLAREDRCDYDERDNLVQQVVRRLAMLGGESMDRAEVTRIIREVLPGERGWSRSLMRGLIAEGVLAELDDDRIAFGYQRLGDIARATVMAEKPLDDMRAWLRGLGENAWRESGTLGALAVIIPERHGVELIDLGGSGGYLARWELSDGFLASLTLRAPGSVSPRTAQMVRQLLGKKSFAAAAWDQLVRIACIPGHPLNAGWLHALLTAFPATDRDRSWSSWLAGTMNSGGETTSCGGRSPEPT